MPRGARSKRVPHQSPNSVGTGHSPRSVTGQPLSPLQPARKGNKKKAVAENAIAIDSLHSKIETMSALLSQVVGSIHQPHMDAEDDGAEIQAADTVPLADLHYNPFRGRHRSDIDNFDSQTRARQRYRSASCWNSAPAPLSRLHRNARDLSYSRPHADPLAVGSTIRPRRHLPTTIQELDES